MITNEELDWATDLPLAEAWKVVHEYNRICCQLRDYPTTELVMKRSALASKHPGICWLIDFKASHPTADEIPLSYKVQLDYDGYDKHQLYIKNFLTKIRHGQG